MILIKNNIKTIKGFLIIFFLTLILIVLLKFTSNDKMLLESKAESFLVKTEKINLRGLKPEYLFYGNVQAQAKVDIVSNLSGKIIKISPKVLSNKYFEKGEKIFELDPFNYKQDLFKKKSQLNDLINELDSTNLIFSEVQQQQMLSEKNYERKKKLVGDIVTKKSLEDAETNLSISNAKVLDIKSKIQNLMASIEIAETQVRVAQRNLRDTSYRAPFKGKLADNLIEIGTELVAGRILGKFINTSELNVEFFVGENAYTHISDIIGKEASVLWEKSNYKKSYTADVFYIDSTINKDRSGLNIRAKLEAISSDDPIKPGVFVKVIIKGNTVFNSFLVHESNIYEDSFILVLEENKAIKKKINIKGFVDERVIVTGEGLNNQNIILTRINNLNLSKKIISKNK
tara:strand:- start:36289 stop:37491 length:1203 start_codon:yes stop_codon:yes gene_type:complete